MIEFKDLELRPELLKIIDKIGWKNPTEIQAKSIPIALTGKDIFGLSETGSGKTAAFCIPLLNDWLVKEKPLLFGLILAPTRELASQINYDLELMGKELGLESALLIGNGDLNDDIEKMVENNCHVIVSTPRRIYQITEETFFCKDDLKSIRHLILDEADRMLDYEFGNDVMRIARLIACKPSKTAATNKNIDQDFGYVRQTQIYSATYCEKMDYLVKDVMYKQEKIILHKEVVTPSQLKQYCLPIEFSDRVVSLLTVILREMQNLYTQKKRLCAIVFVETCKEVRPISEILNEMKIKAVPLHSRLSDKYREENLLKFRKKEVLVLVSTDVAARGIHVEDVDMVINFSVPRTTDSYTHRVGRTARMGKPGTAITLVYLMKHYIKQFKRIEKNLKLGQLEVFEPKPPATEFVNVVHKKWREINKKIRAERDETGEDLEENDMLSVGGTFLEKRMKMNE